MRARSILTLTLLLFGLTGSSLLFNGCSQPADEKKPADKHGAAAGHGDAATTEEGGEEGGEEGEETTHKPVHAAPAPFPSRELTITATDNQLIVGTLYDPDLKPPKPPASEEEEEEAAAEEAGGEEGEEVTTPAAPPKPAKTYPLVILMHQLNGSASDWGDLPKTLVKQGYAVIALDLRGHGRSTKMLNGSARQWRDYSPQDWAKLPSDARRVMETFTGSKDYPEVNGSKVAIIGASIGANAALIRGAEAADRVKAVVLLSPGLDYKGLTTSIPAVKYPNAVFIATSQTDTSSFEATELLYRWAQGPKALRVYKDVGHGTDMLSVEPGLTKDLLTWLAKHFPSGSSTASKPAAEKTHAEAKAAHSSPAAHH